MAVNVSERFSLSGEGGRDASNSPLHPSTKHRALHGMSSLSV